MLPDYLLDPVTGRAIEESERQAVGVANSRLKCTKAQRWIGDSNLEYV